MLIKLLALYGTFCIWMQLCALADQLLRRDQAEINRAILREQAKL